MKVDKSLLPFLVISILELAGRLNQMEELLIYSKPLLMPALIFYVYQSCPAYLLKKFLIAALAFSFLGDVFLMFDNDANLFLFGLGSFLFAHLIYAFIFFNATEQLERKFKVQWQDVVFAIYGLFVFSIIKDGLGDMYIPALIYTVVICLMGITARKRWKKVNTRSFWLVMTGASLFIISDSLLAINKFYQAFELSDFLVMLTYLGAQLLIAKGLIVFLQKIPQEAGS